MAVDDLEELHLFSLKSIAFFFFKKVVPLVKEHAQELEQKYVDSFKTEFTKYLNPTTHRYDVPYEKFRRLLRNNRIILPAGVLSGNGEHALYSLASLENFPTEIKDMSVYISWKSDDETPVVFPKIVLDNAALCMSNMAYLGGLEGVEFLNGGTIHLTGTQYLDIGVEKGQALINAMLSQHRNLTPYEQVVRILGLDFLEYSMLISSGSKLPGVIDWRESGTIYIYAMKHRDLSGYIFEDLVI